MSSQAIQLEGLAGLSRSVKSQGTTKIFRGQGKVGILQKVRENLSSSQSQ